MFNIIKNTYKVIKKYRELTKQLITRSIKLKYRRSFLGYIWSVLSPLMTMIVLTVVFSTFFKRDISNFPVYLLSGQIVFNFFSAMTKISCSTIIENASLIKKTYVPKYIFVFARVTSGFVDYFFSLAALILVMLITKASFSFYNLLFIIPSVEVFIFTFGCSLFLSQANVFFRDINYIYQVFIKALTYLTPMFYPLEILPEKIKFAIVHFNPMFVYVDMFRDCVYRNSFINMQSVLSGFLWALTALLIGGFFFKKNQDNFILYI